jgi:hypothetical protein
MTGYSITTMQATFAPPAPANDTNYPGYALVYKVADEDAPGVTLLEDAIGIGSPQNALDGTQSTFDLFFTARRTTKIAVGHQSGDAIEAAKEVYLDVYSVAGVPSDFPRVRAHRHHAAVGTVEGAARPAWRSSAPRRRPPARCRPPARSWSAARRT